MRYTLAFLLFLPMAPLGEALHSAGHVPAQLMWERIDREARATRGPRPPATWQSLPSSPPWVTEGRMDWREHADGSRSVASIERPLPEVAALLHRLGIDSEQVRQADLVFRTYGPEPSLDDLLGVTVFDHPPAWGPFRRHRMRAFRWVDGLPVEAPELAADLGDYHPCATAAHIDDHLAGGLDHRTTVQLSTDGDFLAMPLLWPDATDLRVRRRLGGVDPKEELGLLSETTGPLGSLIPGTLGWLAWRQRRARHREGPLLAMDWVAFLSAMLWVRQPVFLLLVAWQMLRGPSAMRPCEVTLMANASLPWWALLGPTALVGAGICTTTWWTLPRAQRLPVAVGGLLGSLVGAAGLLALA